MNNRFGIPTDVLTAITKRDTRCSYCQKHLLYPYEPLNRNDSATIEHLSYDGPFYWKEGLIAEDIVMACGMCNSSRGPKPLSKWFLSEYCTKKRIDSGSVSVEVRHFIERYPLK